MSEGPGPIVQVSTGYRVEPNLLAYPSIGTTQNPHYVSLPVPSQILAARSSGQFNMGFAGRQGTIEVDVVLGTAPGASTALVVLSDDLSGSGVGYNVIVWIDTQNRPSVLLKQNSTTTIAAWAASGAALTSGTPLKLRLKWDSATLLPSGSYVDFTTIAGNAVPGSWSTPPTTPWASAFFAGVLVGTASGFAYSDFGATVNEIRVGTGR